MELITKGQNPCSVRCVLREDCCFFLEVPNTIMQINHESVTLVAILHLQPFVFCHEMPCILCLHSFVLLRRPNIMPPFTLNAFTQGPVLESSKGCRSAQYSSVQPRTESFIYCGSCLSWMSLCLLL